MMLNVGCASSHATNDFCLWAAPIRLTVAEMNAMDEHAPNAISEGTARQIDNYNQEYVRQCMSK